MSHKLNKFQSYYLSIKLTLITLYFASLAIIKNLLNKNSRANNDKIIRQFAYYILKPLKINLIYKNWQVIQDITPNKPIILMSNHSSLYDIPLILHSIPKNISIRMLAKKELLKYPIFGKGMLKLEFPVVDRKNTTQARKDLEHTKKLMQSGIVLWAAPEGTRSNNGELLPFKKGIFIMAIEIGATIIPITIKGANKVLPANSYNYSINQIVELKAGTPLDTSKYTLADRDQIMSIIRQEIASGL